MLQNLESCSYPYCARSTTTVAKQICIPCSVSWFAAEAGVSAADDRGDETTEPRPPAPTWNAVPTTAAAAMAAGPLPPAPADPAPPAPPGPSPEEPSDDAGAASAPAPKGRRVLVPAGDHLWGGRGGAASVVAVCPRTAAVLEPCGLPEGPCAQFPPAEEERGPAEDEPPRRLHLVCRRGARLWGQVRAGAARHSRGAGVPGAPPSQPPRSWRGPSRYRREPSPPLPSPPPYPLSVPAGTDH
jgi:hypothetical protein